MISLRAKGKAVNVDEPLVAKVTTDKDDYGKVYLAKHKDDLLGVNLSRFKGVITTETDLEGLSINGKPLVYRAPFLSHLETDDIVVINQNGGVDTLFRKRSPHNALFITDRCNSNCLMCSQPPKDIDDLAYHYEINAKLIPLIPKDTQELGITGGEPTLLGERLRELFVLLKEELPETEIHMLTNGRVFAWKNVVQSLSSVENPRVVFGIPLYSDYYAQHDYIMQAKDAFAQTVLGLHNLARYDQRIEIRIVLHKQSYTRLPQLARFIYKNLPFVEHIAFMGLEYVGYTPHNDALLWIEPSQYVGQLAEAVEYLDDFGMNVSIYNLPLCLLPQHLWKLCRKSISDWKREYLEECQKCRMLNECGGVFATSRRYSEEIKAIQ